MADVWQVWARDQNRQKMGILKSWTAKFLLRKNLVGTWELTVPLDQTPELWTYPNSGIVVLQNNKVIMSGSWEEFNWDWSSDPESEDVQPGMFRISGADDKARLAYHIVYASWDRPWNQQDQVAHYTHTNNAEEVMRVLVNRQCGSLSLNPRRVPGLRLGPSSNIGGPNVTIQERFTPMMEALRKVATLQNLVFDVKDSLTGFTDFVVTQPRNLTNKVRFGVDLGNVTEMNIHRTSPIVQTALVAGQEEGVARQLVEVNNDDIGPLWGRREKFIDQRQTDDISEQTKAGEEALIDGDQKFSVTVRAIDTDLVKWGRDYNLGDRVTVKTEFGEVTDTIEEVEINIDSQGNSEIFTTIGASDAKKRDPIGRTMIKLQTRLSQLERAL